MPKKKPKSAFEVALELDARKRGVPFGQAAQESLDYHKKLTENGVVESEESYGFFQNMIRSILHQRKGGGSEKKE